MIPSPSVVFCDTQSGEHRHVLPVPEWRSRHLATTETPFAAGADQADSESSVGMLGGALRKAGQVCHDPL